MFIQPVSMKCSQDQYESDLKQPLLEMGYNETDVAKWNKHRYLVTNYTGFEHKISNADYVDCESHSRYFIDHYNPELFLALAAMTEKKEAKGGEFGGKGEWVVKNNRFEKLHRKTLFYNDWRKATKEELINKFTKKEEMEKRKDLRELLQSGNIVEFSNGDTGIVIDTHLGRLIQSGQYWCMTSSYDEELNVTCEGETELNIIRVREIQYGGDILPGYWKAAPIIWERKEPKEMTLDELIKEAGYEKGEVKIKVE